VLKISLMTLRVISRPSIVALRKAHSITSSASASSVGGTLQPSILAVLSLQPSGRKVVRIKVIHSSRPSIIGR
jgi:hypothetical protein